MIQNTGSPIADSQKYNVINTTGSDMAKKLTDTVGKSLAEAGQSGVYSIGMSLNNKDLFDTQRWSKNLLGKLLMKVREELL